MKRYDISCEGDCLSYDKDMYESLDGDYVLYDDYCAEIDALTAERDELKQRLLDADAYNGALEAAEFALSRVTAERDEARAKLDEMQGELHVNRKRCGVLQSRLDAIVAMLKDEIAKTDNTAFGRRKRSHLKSLHARATAIAEGRKEA